jgi:hypothetical protein
MVKRRYLDVEKKRWGLHSIITIGGTPYCVFQKWELWKYRAKSSDGGRSVEAVPTGELSMEPLVKNLPDDQLEGVVEDHG